MRMLVNPDSESFSYLFLSVESMKVYFKIPLLNSSLQVSNIIQWPPCVKKYSKRFFSFGAFWETSG